jgi:twitching motility protein PilT
MKIDPYLEESLKQNASDLHFVSGDPVRARVHGNLTPIMEEVLTIDTVSAAMTEIMDGVTRKTFEAHDAADFAYEIEGVSRFRVNVLRHLNGIAGIFRAIPSTAMSLDDLDMPDVIRDLCRHTQGMILVTGKTGYGK